MGLVRKLQAIIATSLSTFGVLLFLAAPVHAASTTIGVIMTGNIKYYEDVHNAFMASISNPNISVVVQTPMPEPLSWANAARKLVVIGSDIIVAYGAPATLTAMKATSDIPIIFAGVYGPELMNITGKNATGISSTVSVATLVRNLKEIKNFSSLGVIFNKSEKDTILQAREVKKLEGSVGFSTKLFSVSDKMDPGMIKGVDALMLTASCAGMKCIASIVKASRANKIPTASTIAGGEEAGVLLTISANAEEQGRVAAEMAKKILSGTKVADLPVAAHTKTDVIVNIAEARSIGVQVPSSVLAAATRTIK